MHRISKKSKRTGFGVIEISLIVAVVAIVSGLGYAYYQNKSTVTSNSPGVSQGVPAGTTSSIIQLTEQDAQTEAGLDKSTDSQTQHNATSANAAANDVGGAYNASDF